uniref:Uncharacterized protein n=1 Tax=Panagrolaimus davidi TaxID=227884 RepID=A0A914Q2I3_9BILA
MFFGSLRVTLVIVLQVFITSIIFILQSIDTLKKILELGNFQNCAWIFGSMGLTMPISLQMFRQLRILFEAILVLTVMTGYREAIISFFTLIFFVIKHPIEAFRSLRYPWRTS